jgi:hypothetical protein
VASSDTPLEDAEKEALRIINSGQEKGIPLRLLGGIAIKFRCKSAKHRALTRHYADIDMVGLARQRKQLKALLPELGYEARERFNMMQGERLIFNDLQHSRRIDIFLDILNMCHKLNFKDRLNFHPYTLSPADLLMTKLQVVEFTEREVKDVLALLMDFRIVTTDDQDAINGKYIAQVCRNDWGIFKTFTINLDKIKEFLPTYLTQDSDTVKQRVEELIRMIQEAPKTARWKMRAAVGEKKRWYELPEADRSIVESTLVQKTEKLKAKDPN